MLSNNNLNVCGILLWRDIKFHRVKYLILAVASMLVTALYSFVFLLGSSVESAYLLNDQYAYGSTSHILYTGLTDRQADTLAQHKNVKSAVRLSTVGQVSDPAVGQRLVKLAVADQAYAKTVLSLPTAGRLPTRPGEIALDEFTMDSLGVMREVGTLVNLTWTDLEGGEHTSEFTLCGWWASPTNLVEACAWITADTAGELISGSGEEQARHITLGVRLYQPKDLEEQAAALLEEQGLAGITYTTNLAYQDARREMASSEAVPFYAPAALVLLCGCLMVYSVVHVSAGRDRMFFAGLKSLGMTPRQMRCLFFGQGGTIVALGLAPGWLMGFLLHFSITNRVISGMEENPACYFLSWKPFAAGAFCTLVTVWIAYLLPAVRLSHMTPAQTVRLVLGRLPRRRRVSSGRTTLVQMAFRTLGCRRMRTLFSVVSLLFAVLLLNCVWIQYISFQEEVYLSVMSPWDYSLVDGSAYLSAQRYNERNQGIQEKDVKELRSRPEVSSVSTLKSRELKLEASDELRRRIVDYYKQPFDETQTLRDTQEAYPEWCDGLDRLEQQGEYIGLVIGLDGAYLDYVLEHCPFTSGSFDADAFSSGAYVLAAGAYWEGVSTPAAGEDVELGGHKFAVMGSVKHDDSYLCGTNSNEAAFNIAYFLPAETFDRLFPGQCYRQLAVNIDGSRQMEFEEYLDAYERGLNRGVGITKRSEYQENFAVARLNMVLPELVIGLVLFGVSLLNFINMLVIKTVSREGEFAVYESLGMTRVQLHTLLLLEGIFHALLLAVVLAPVTILFDGYAMPAIVDAMKSWTMVYTCSLLPLGVAVSVIVPLAVAVPLSCLHLITKGSLNDRMRKIK